MRPAGSGAEGDGTSATPDTSATAAEAAVDARLAA
jgi:hypothetical protein